MFGTVGLATRQRMLDEWPTWLLAVVIYTAFVLLTWNHHRLPWWFLLPAGAYVVAWHSSLQHEVVHGHPTPWRWVNELLVFPNLWLWMPFGHYRSSHLRHHRNQFLTVPGEDPESSYMSAEQWRDVGPCRRRLLGFNNTLAGRLLIGPAVAAGRFWTVSLSTKGGVAWRSIGSHLLSCALVLTWVVCVCDIPLLSYVLFFAYPGTSVALLRSFAEHRARPEPDERTVVVEAEQPLALLYLNNNLHSVHHRYPQLPWYELPRRWRVERADILRRNGGYLIAGYRELLCKYLFHAKEPVSHPLS